MIHLISKLTRTFVLTGALVCGTLVGATAKDFADMKFTIIFYTDASVEFWIPPTRRLNDPEWDQIVKHLKG